MSIVSGIGLLLAAEGVGDYAEDRPLDPEQVPIAVGVSPPEPARVVVLNTYAGGPEPDSRNGWEYPRLQVRVRDATPEGALDLDRAAFDVLQTAAGDLGDGWLLQDCYALQSTAEPLGQDAAGRHEYVRNYQLTCEPA